MRKKRVNTYEELIGLMKTLEKYKFRWVCGEHPTEATKFIPKDELPINIVFGYGAYSPKVICYERVLK